MTLHDYSMRAIRSYVESKGYRLVPNNSFPWEKPCEFSKRHGREKTWYSKRRTKLPPHEKEKGKTGRVVRIRSNPELEAFVKKPENKGCDVGWNGPT